MGTASLLLMSSIIFMFATSLVNKNDYVIYCAYTSVQSVIYLCELSFCLYLCLYCCVFVLLPFLGEYTLI